MSVNPPVIPTQTQAPVDIVIVGGGPVGLFAAFYAGLRRLSVTVIDSHDELGGQLSGFYPNDSIYDIPGRPAILASHLVHDLASQAHQARPKICLSEFVSGIESNADTWNVVTNKALHPAKAVVLALGIGAIRPKSVTSLQGPSAGIFHRLADISRVQPAHVCILGGDQRTRQTVATLRSRGWKVSLVSSHHLAKDSLHEVVHYEHHEVLSVTNERSGSVVFLRSRGGAEVRLRVDCVLVQAGLETSLRPLLGWGLALEGGGIRVDATMATSRHGIYAVGDIAFYPGKVKLIAVGFGEAATAVNHIAHRMNPSQKVFPGYSTSVAPRSLPLFGTSPHDDVGLLPFG